MNTSNDSHDGSNLRASGADPGPMLPVNAEAGSLADVKAEVIRELMRFAERRIGPKCGCRSCTHMRGILTLAREMVP